MYHPPAGLKTSGILAVFALAGGAGACVCVLWLNRRSELRRSAGFKRKSGNLRASFVLRPLKEGLRNKLPSQ